MAGAKYSYSIQGGPASTYPPREFIEQQQRQQQEQHYQQHYDEDTVAPLFSKNPPSRNPNRGSIRPPSSVYSQTSPTNAAFPPSQQQQQQQQPQQYQYYQEYQQAPHRQDQYQYQHQYPSRTYQNYQGPKPRNADGVSPESSPELTPATPVLGARPPTPPSVYPEEHTEHRFAMSQPQPKPQAQGPGPRTDSRIPGASRSNIPMMRRERRQNQEAASRTLRETKSKELLRAQKERAEAVALSQRGYKGGEVRWDPATGELTSSNKGRPSQVKPAEYAKGLGITGNEAPTSPTGSSHDIKPTASAGLQNLAHRLKRTAQGAAAGMRSAATEAAKPHEAPKEQELSPPRTAVREETMASPATPISPAPVSLPSTAPAVQPPPISPSTDPASGAFSTDRPAWHGASGRTALVAPVRDTRDVAPLNIPRKSSKRVASSPKLREDAAASSPRAMLPSSRNLASPPVSPPPPANNETLRTETVRQVVPSGSVEQQQAPTPPQHRTILEGQQQTFGSPTDPSPAQSYPSPPLSGGPTNNRVSAIKRKPTPSHQAMGSFDESDPFNYNNKFNPASSSTPSPTPPKPPVHDAWVQPPSRFSVTTYASTTRDSLQEFDPRDAPEMPPFPDSLQPSPYPNSHDDHFQQYQKRSPGLGVDNSVMDRQRPLVMSRGSPKPTPGNEPVVISLKTPWMSGNRAAHLQNGGIGDDYRSSVSSSSSGGDDGAIRPSHRLDPRIGARLDHSPSRQSMAGSVHKMLPPVPPEVAAKDRVAMLNAQLANLTQRRVNIDRSIKQMTELMPTDNLLASADVLFKREQEKRKVNGLKMEMSEIQREEYEIGLKLHRAYKRLDRDAEYEPTTLWVRRVTG